MSRRAGVDSNHRSELHPLIRAGLEINAESARRHRERRARRQRALQNPLANAELAAAEAEQDAIFDLTDQLDDLTAQLDQAALDQEHDDDDR